MLLIFFQQTSESVRINIFGDEIEKFEEFNPKNQKSIQSLFRLIIKPFNEFSFNQSKRTIKADTFLTDLSTFEQDDLIVHVDHGIGKFNGLKNVTVLENDHVALK